MSRFFSQVITSVTDFSSYRKIVRQKLSATFLYFFLLLFVITGILTIINYFYFKAELESFAAWAKEKLPELVIKDGVLSSPVNQPYTVVEKNFVFTLDTTGKITRFDPQHAQGVLLMKDRALVKREGIETQDILFNWVKELKVDGLTIQAWKERALALLLPVLFVLFLVGLILSKTLQAFLFSVAVWAFSSPERTGLGLREIFNVSVYAATPAILLSTLVQVWHWEIPYFPFVYFFLYAAFFIGALTQCRIHPDSGKDLFYDV